MRSLARRLTIIANCKAYSIDPYIFHCDVFRLVKNTAKDPDGEFGCL